MQDSGILYLFIILTSKRYRDIGNIVVRVNVPRDRASEDAKLGLCPWETTGENMKRAERKGF